MHDIAYRALVDVQIRLILCVQITRVTSYVLDRQ